MIDFQWTVSFGHLLGTTVLGALILGAFYRVTKRYREALARITQLEMEVARLQHEILSLMEIIKASVPRQGE